MILDRYLVQVILIFLMGIAGATFTNVPALFHFLGIAFVVIILISSYFLFRKKIVKAKTFSVIIIFIAFIFGYSYSGIVCTKNFPDVPTENEKITFIGFVCDQNNKYTDIEAISGNIRKGTKIRVYNLENEDKATPIKPFHKGNFTLTLSECPNYIKSDGITFYGKGFVKNIEKHDGNYFSKSIYDVKTYISEKINSINALSRTSRAFIKAIILGDTSELSSKSYADYNRLGISHIVAVSGLHFTVIVLSLFKILQFLGFGLKTRSIICIPFAIFYCFLTGCSPSSVRALIMITIYFIGRIVLSLVDSMTSLTIAAAIICSINPYSFYSTGFVLSFVATFAIAIAPSFLGLPDFYHQPKHMKRIDAVVQSLFISSIISLIIFPILHFRFQTVSIITPISNIIISFLFTGLMYISLATCILSIFTFSSQVFNVVNYLIECFHSFINNFASIKGISIIPSKELLLIVIILISICIFIGLFFKKRKREKIIKIIVVTYLIVILINTVVSSIILNNTENIAVSENNESILIVSNGDIYLFCKDENSINSNFVYENKYVDIKSLVILNTIDVSKAEYKLSTFTSQCKVDCVYTDSPVNFDGAEIKPISALDVELFHISRKADLNISFRGKQNFMILGDNIDAINKNMEIDKLILTDSFFKNNKNIYSLPKSINKIYVSNDFLKTPMLKAIIKKYNSPKLYSIDDFEYNDN